MQHTCMYIDSISICKKPEYRQGQKNRSKFGCQLHKANNMARSCLMRCVYYKYTRCDLKTFHSARLSGDPMSMYSRASLVCKLFIQDIHRTLYCLDAPHDDRETCSIISHRRNRVVPGSAPQFVASTSMA
jgi:hypothetical protein